MKLTLENTISGPLAHQRTRQALVEAVEDATTIKEAVEAIEAIPTLATYRGGRHVAVHPRTRGQFAHGSSRLAIVTE